jgi:hypothetical protein
MNALSQKSLQISQLNLTVKLKYLCKNRILQANRFQVASILIRADASKTQTEIIFDK